VTRRPVAVFSDVCWLPAGQSSDHFLGAFVIDADTNQGAITSVHSPVTRVAVPFDRHDVSSLTAAGQSGEPCPRLTLLAFAPAAISRFVAEPGAAGLRETLHGRLVPVAVGAVVVIGLRRALGRWLRWSLEAEPL
jgi:hypothetical protein